jgi:alkanesulfonate monooxygenase SsuD/methylene tetrahydromethanopterin reductase-like flavin-dependent oxidoreductase (luciferase family)
VSKGTNPLRGRNRLKLGVFNINGDGNSRTLVPERFQFNWANSLDVALQADRLKLEAIVPYARFRSLVDARHKSAFTFENFTWSSAIAAHTRHSCIMSTVNVLNVHPILAAKAMATIDHVSNGRFALNIVIGWFKEEIEMFGTDFLSHEERYAYGDEWITVIKRLWDEEDEFDFNGTFFKLKGAMSQPKPIQRPGPMLMNAGGSPAGRNFVSKHGDIAFIRAERVEDMRKEADAYRATAREQHGRELQIWVYCGLVHGDSESDALALADRYAAHADETYVDSAFEYSRRDLPLDVAKQLKRKYTAAGTGTLLCGDAKGLADQLEQISAAGVDGVLLTWVDFQTGIRRFGTEILPILEARKLRHPA